MLRATFTSSSVSCRKLFPPGAPVVNARRSSTVAYSVAVVGGRAVGPSETGRFAIRHSRTDSGGSIVDDGDDRPPPGTPGNHFRQLTDDDVKVAVRGPEKNTF